MSTELGLPTLAELRQRQSVKWRLYGEDVLPLWVAELDVALAPAVQQVLTRAVELSDTGYCWPWELGAAFAGFAQRRWDWSVDPTRCHAVPDVMTGVGEALERLTAPGDGVIICPPVYPPFFSVPAMVGRRVVEVPLLPDGSLDLAGIDHALAAGARAVLLCNPHNPTGRVWSDTELDGLDEVARRHDGLVLSDEIHAPLTLPGAVFSPYLRGGRRGVALVSASKAFNLAGLKAALMVAGSADLHDRLAARPPELAHRVGHFGVLAGAAAWTEGDAWLDALLVHLDDVRSWLTGELAGLTATPWEPPQAGYLAWLDLGRTASELLTAGVAVSDGADFGRPGWVRLNAGTSKEVLRAALDRLRA